MQNPQSCTKQKTKPNNRREQKLEWLSGVAVIVMNVSIYPCECLTPVNEFYLGNIIDKTFDGLVYSNEFENLIQKYNGVNPECFDCNVIEYCRGGCLNRRLPAIDLNNGKDYYCNARKKIIEEINIIVQKQEKLPNVDLQA